MKIYGWLNHWEQMLESELKDEAEAARGVSDLKSETIYHLKFGVGSKWIEETNLYRLRIRRLRSMLKLIDRDTEIDIESIRDKSDIVRVAESLGLEVKRRKICCVFHSEKTPSCHLYLNSYHCFGCGEHGSVFDLIMKVEGVEFIDAVKIAESI